MVAVLPHLIGKEEKEIINANPISSHKPLKSLKPLGTP